MATEITLCIEDDGSMTVEAGEKEETTEQENAEGGKMLPVKSLDEAVSVIKQLAAAATMPTDNSQAQAQAQAQGDDTAQADDGQDEEAAMMGSYRQGSTGR